MSKSQQNQASFRKENKRTVASPPMSGRYSRKEGITPRTRKGTRPPKA